MSMDYRSYIADGAIERSRILKAGATVGTLTKATGSTDNLIGTSDTGLDKVSGEPVDLELRPVGHVKLGGTVAFGDPITADANAKGVKATPAVGANVRIIGFALSAGVLDDEIPYRNAPGTHQG